MISDKMRFPTAVGSGLAYITEIRWMYSGPRALLSASVTNSRGERRGAFASIRKSIRCYRFSIMRLSPRRTPTQSHVYMHKPGKHQPHDVVIHRDHREESRMHTQRLCNSAVGCRYRIFQNDIGVIMPITAKRVRTRTADVQVTS